MDICAAAGEHRHGAAYVPEAAQRSPHNPRRDNAIGWVCRRPQEFRLLGRLLVARARRRSVGDETHYPPTSDDSQGVRRSGGHTLVIIDNKRPI